MFPKLRPLLLAALLSAGALAATPDGEASAAPRVFTNEDLKGAGGNLTFSEPGEESSYEGTLPRERPDPDAAAREAEIAKMKGRYQILRGRAERLEEVELPAARDAAAREFATRWVLVNGVPTAVRVEDENLPHHEKLRRLAHELRQAKDEIAALEAKAKKMGLGRPALMQR